MAEHSMCHPGRPWPQGDAQEISPGLAAFQTPKSAAFFLPEPASLFVSLSSPGHGDLRNRSSREHEKVSLCPTTLELCA